jgi:hypothetical protein
MFVVGSFPAAEAVAWSRLSILSLDVCFCFFDAFKHNQQTKKWLFKQQFFPSVFFLSKPPHRKFKT